MLSSVEATLVGGLLADILQAPSPSLAALSLWDYRCGMTWNSRAIPHRHLKQTHAYGRDRQTEHKCLGAAPKLAELVKVVLWVEPEIEILRNHSEPKRRVQNASNTPPRQGYHASDNRPARSWFRRFGAISVSCTSWPG
jgi:hypothetical protein